MEDEEDSVCESRREIMQSQCAIRRLFLVMVLVEPAVISSLRIPLLGRQTATDSAATFIEPTAATIEPSPTLSRASKRDNNESKYLCFVGETCVRSEPAICPDSAVLRDFFFEDEHRNLLLSEKGNIRVNDDLVEIDCFVGFRRGLQICSTTIIDAQLLPSAAGKDHELPSYCFELVDSKLTASGMKPLVWLFERLMSSETKTISSKSTTMVTCEQTSPKSIAFKTHSRIEVSINVPDYLAKFASSGTIEAQGNHAMQRFLEGEVEPSLQRFRDSYCKFVATNDVLQPPLAKSG